MVSVSLRELLEAGVHFGHQTGRWNPKMKPYIVAKKNGIYIIDLQKTRHAWSEALQYVEEQAAQGGKILSVPNARRATSLPRRLSAPVSTTSTIDGSVDC